MLCYLGSTLYNSAAGAPVHRWPWFDRLWPWIDRQMGWDDEGETTPFWLYSLGRPANVNVPPFVARSYGSVTAAYVFMGVWAVLPLLYAFNFLCMILMSKKSPGKWIQRGLCVFGILHFMFWTDAVAYKYGRGFRNEWEDFFHWTEKWSWRIGIFVPLFQHCTNGHWGPKSHPKSTVFGIILKYFAIIWGIGFFIFQTLQSDVPRTYGFLTDGDSSRGFLKRWGLTNNPMIAPLNYPYFSALVWMWMLYALLHFTGIRLHRICLQLAPSSNGVVKTPIGRLLV